MANPTSTSRVTAAPPESPRIVVPGTKGVPVPGRREGDANGPITRRSSRGGRCGLRREPLLASATRHRFAARGDRYRGAMLRLSERVVVITGAGSGIGRATALLAAAEGAVVAAVDADGAGLDSTVDAVRGGGGHIVVRVVDVADRQDLAAAIDALAADVGPFHGVFANAGILPPPVPVATLDWQQWDRVLSVNLTGAVSTLVSSLPHVVDGASLLVSGSSLAIRPREQRLAYVAAKAGLHAAARALAIELAVRRIRVNVLAPGLTDTPMVRRIPGHIEGGTRQRPTGSAGPSRGSRRAGGPPPLRRCAARDRRGLQRRRRAHRRLTLRRARRAGAGPQLDRRTDPLLRDCRRGGSGGLLRRR